MKIKGILLAENANFIKKRRIFCKKQDAKIDGTAVMTFIDLVSDKEVLSLETKQFAIADSGYLWLQILKNDKNYIQNTVFDENGTLVCWRYDIFENMKVDKKGRMIYDSLVLNIVLFPNGKHHLCGVEEFEQAIANSEISKDSAELAYKTADEIRTEMPNVRQIYTNSIETFSYILRNYDISDETKDSFIKKLFGLKKKFQR